MYPIELDEEGVKVIEMTALAPAVELLENLSTSQREAIEAHHLDERGYAEIASDLCCSESVVRKRVSRGLAAMQAQLDEGRTA